jgi:hypothetical protein
MRRSSEGSAGSASGGFAGSGAGQAARRASEPDLGVGEASDGQYSEPFRPGAGDSRGAPPGEQQA